MTEQFMLRRFKAEDGKTYEYNPWLLSYREVDEHREMAAAQAEAAQAAGWPLLHRGPFPSVVRAEDMHRECVRDGWIMGEHPVRFLRGNDHD